MLKAILLLILNFLACVLEQIDSILKFRATIDLSSAEGNPAMQQSLRQLGVEPLPMTPAQMDDFVRQETASNLELIKAVGIQQ